MSASDSDTVEIDGDTAAPAPAPAATSGVATIGIAHAFNKPGDDDDDHCGTLARKVIRAAFVTLVVAMFEFTDPSMLEELARAACRGVAVSLVLDGSRLPDFYRYVLGLDAHPSARAVAAALDAVVPRAMRIARLGAHARLACGSIMHHKFVVADGEIVASGSFNFTRSAARRNYEDIIVLRDAVTGAAYASRFVQLANSARPLPRVR